MDIDYLKIIVTIVLAAIGWMFGHYLSAKRDAKTKKRELVTEHLIKSFEAIVAFSAVVVGNVPGSRNIAGDFNNAITKIQLLGSSKQIELINKITEMMSEKKNIDREALDMLLCDLRKELRVELNLNDVNEKISVARIVYAEDSGKMPNK